MNPDWYCDYGTRSRTIRYRSGSATTRLFFGGGGFYFLLYWHKNQIRTVGKKIHVTDCFFIIHFVLILFRTHCTWTDPCHTAPVVTSHGWCLGGTRRTAWFGWLRVYWRDFRRHGEQRSPYSRISGYIFLTSVNIIILLRFIVTENKGYGTSENTILILFVGGQWGCLRFAVQFAIAAKHRWKPRAERIFKRWPGRQRQDFLCNPGYFYK